MTEKTQHYPYKPAAVTGEILATFLAGISIEHLLAPKKVTPALKVMEPTAPNLLSYTISYQNEAAEQVERIVGIPQTDMLDDWALIRSQYPSSPTTDAMYNLRTHEFIDLARILPKGNEPLYLTRDRLGEVVLVAQPDPSEDSRWIVWFDRGEIVEVESLNGSVISNGWIATFDDHVQWQLQMQSFDGKLQTAFLLPEETSPTHLEFLIDGMEIKDDVVALTIREIKTGEVFLWTGQLPSQSEMMQPGRPPLEIKPISLPPEFHAFEVQNPVIEHGEVLLLGKKAHSPVSDEAEIGVLRFSLDTRTIQVTWLSGVTVSNNAFCQFIEGTSMIVAEDLVPSPAAVSEAGGTKTVHLFDLATETAEAVSMADYQIPIDADVRSVHEFAEGSDALYTLILSVLLFAGSIKLWKKGVNQAMSKGVGQETSEA